MGTRRKMISAGAIIGIDSFSGHGGEGGRGGATRNTKKKGKKKGLSLRDRKKSKQTTAIKPEGGAVGENMPAESGRPT